MTPANILAAFRTLAFIHMVNYLIHISCIPLEFFFREKETLKKVVTLKRGKEAVGKFLQQKFEKIKSGNENINQNTTNLEKVGEKLQTKPWRSSHN